jgi:hypothetical protein
VKLEAFKSRCDGSFTVIHASVYADSTEEGFDRGSEHLDARSASIRLITIRAC